MDKRLLLCLLKDFHTCPYTEAGGCSLNGTLCSGYNRLQSPFEVSASAVVTSESAHTSRPDHYSVHRLDTN